MVSCGPRLGDHLHVVDPPSGKHLRVCLDCVNRLLECSRCDAVEVSGPHVLGSGWAKCGVHDPAYGVLEWTYCPSCP